MPELIRSARTIRRYRSESIFQWLCFCSITVTAVFLVFLIASLAVKAIPALSQHAVTLAIKIDPEKIDASNIAASDFPALLKDSVAAKFPEATNKSEIKKVAKLISSSVVEDLQRKVAADPTLIGKTITVNAPLSADADSFLKGIQPTVSPTGDNSEFEESALLNLQKKGKIQSQFAWSLLTNGDSRAPEKAGMLGAFMGSLFTILISLVLALPLGVAAALYLEEFARKNRFTDLIEVNINNLAAVPSIIFGLLGLAVFLNIFGLPRSSPLVGGLVLTLLVLPCPWSDNLRQKAA